MKQLKELEEAEQILTEDDMDVLVQPIIALPTSQEEMALIVNKKFVLVNYQIGYLPSKTYMCVYDGTQYVWKLINYTEDGTLPAPTHVWAKSIRHEDSGRATVYIHWDDPSVDDETSDAHWLYSVVVKKKGSAPASLYDGEVVGYSSVRNQYSKKLAFVDDVDIDTVDDRDLTDDSTLTIKPTDYYYYKVFAVTRYGKVSGSDAFLGMLTWEKLQELIREGVAENALSLGEVVQINHTQLGRLDFQVVAFDNATLKDTSLTHSVTFMSCDILFRGSFDHKELEYGPIPDGEKDSWNGAKTYYYLSDTDTYSIITSRLQEIYTTPRLFEVGMKTSVCEKNPCPSASNYGRNSWQDSNIRHWLNSEASSWFTAQSIWDTYSTDVLNHGSMGVPKIDGYSSAPILFDGFLGGIKTGEPELYDVLTEVKVKVRHPRWHSLYLAPDENDRYPDCVDKIFLPSFKELFGELQPKGDVDLTEGTQFDIYRLGKTDSRMKTVLRRYNTTPNGDPKPISSLNNLANIYTRTACYMKVKDPGLGTESEDSIDAVEVVSVDSRQFDSTRTLGADQESVSLAYMAAKDTSKPGSDLPRDTRNNYFTPHGSTIQYSNNTSPGFAPCFVVA